MKTKVFVLAALTILIAACKKDKSMQEGIKSYQKEVITQEMLLGIWSESFHVNPDVRSLLFKEDGTLIYVKQPDTTFNIVFLYGPEVTTLQYEITGDKLSISGESTKYPLDGPSYVEPFSYTTGCSIKDDELSIVSFSYDGVSTINPFVLYKQEDTK